MTVLRKVAIDAQILDTTMGGVSSHLAALVKSLGELDGPEYYYLVCAQENPNWLCACIGENQEIVLGPARPARQLVKRVFGKHWQRIWALGYTVASRTQTRFAASKRMPVGAVTDMSGYFEALGVSLVHAFSQVYLRTSLRVIFNPHDLQHEHFPQFFTPEVLARRRMIYRTACQEAAVIVAASQFTKADVIQQYGIPWDKIFVIPFAPATLVHSERDDVSRDDIASMYDLPGPFVLYPAATWEHKNHLRLLEAIVLLRNEGMRINLVCTGRRVEPTWGMLARFVAESELQDQVRFLDFVPGGDLRALYRASDFVIAPSLFEQASGPMFEAWQEGTAVAASNVTSIPDRAGNAALLFDPNSVMTIADALRTLWVDIDLRNQLEQRGRARLQQFTWEKTAKAYRALYRCVGGWSITEEDRYLLSLDWMSNRSNPHVC